MNVLHLSWSDVQGGAAKAAYRLHQALPTIGVNSQMLVEVKGSQAPSIFDGGSIINRIAGRMSSHWDQFYVRRYKSRKPLLFSPAKAVTRTARRAYKISKDIYHLHWITNGFLKVEDLRTLEKPLVWTLHDLWGFTGGCHYGEGCSRFETECGYCPVLGSRVHNDLSRETWERKCSAWRDIDLTLIAPSRWMARMAASSALFRSRRIEVIPYCLDTQIFCPTERAVARRRLSLPHDKHVVLFSALTGDGDKRKGLHLLQSAFEILAKDGNAGSICLAVAGMNGEKRDASFSFDVHYLGILKREQEMALACAAADVFVAPSMEDNLPNTVLEAMSCGTSCVAFDIGGMGDMIDHRMNGYLAKPFDVDDLAMGIRWVLADENRRRSLSDAARKKVMEEYGFEPIARRHMRLYEDLTLTTKRSKGTSFC